MCVCVGNVYGVGVDVGVGVGGGVGGVGGGGLFHSVKPEFNISIV